MDTHKNRHYTLPTYLHGWPCPNLLADHDPAGRAPTSQGITVKEAQQGSYLNSTSAKTLPSSSAYNFACTTDPNWLHRSYNWVLVVAAGRWQQCPESRRFKPVHMRADSCLYADISHHVHICFMKKYLDFSTYFVMVLKTKQKHTENTMLEGKFLKWFRNFLNFLKFFMYFHVIKLVIL